MGNTSNPNQPLQKGEGYRITAIKENSPFQGNIDVFFDFIIEVIPPQVQKSPTEILDKLSPGPKRTAIKSPFQIINESIDKNIKIKIVSTKYRNVRTIQITPNNKWGNGNDLIGISVRRERFDEAFETYFPIVDIKINSPIQKAGVKEGQYLIGCLEYPYESLDAFTQGLYERFFDKESNNKNIHLGVYDIASDTLYLKQVSLARGWGGKGLLGCQFLQGMLNKFPSNLQEQRKQIIKREEKKSELIKLRNELGQCDGASKLLAQTLQAQKNKRQRHNKLIKNLLNIHPPNIQFKVVQQGKQQPQAQRSSAQKDLRIQQLQQRVGYLQSSFLVLKRFFQEYKNEDCEEGCEHEHEYG